MHLQIQLARMGVDVAKSKILLSKISTKKALEQTTKDLADVLKQKSKLPAKELDLRLNQVLQNLDSMSNHSHDICTGPIKPTETK